MQEKVNGRLAKWIAAAGLCSRREAERWIVDGRVKIDNELCLDPAINVDKPERISVDNARLPASVGPRLYKFHKPKGIIVSDHDPEGRPTLYDVLPKQDQRLMAVGRLDINSEGLILLTNNGELKRKLELPATGLARRYKVRVFGTPSDKTLAALRLGVCIEGIHYGAIDVKLDRSQGANSWLEVVLYEGKNREIRRVFEHFGHPVSRLIRIAYGPLELGELAKRELREVNRSLLVRYFGIGPLRKSSWAKAKEHTRSNRPRARGQKRYEGAVNDEAGAVMGFALDPRTGEPMGNPSTNRVLKETEKTRGKPLQREKKRNGFKSKEPQEGGKRNLNDRRRADKKVVNNRIRTKPAFKRS